MKMEKNALLIGSVLDIPIRLHISLLIVIGFFGLSALASGGSILAVAILAVGLFGSVALHELGHSVVARAKGSYIHEIVLYPFGGAARISNIPKNPLDEAMVALAGPAVSLVLGLFFRNFEITGFLGYLNMMLFFFNILPVFPMDGGRVLRAALTLKRGRGEATRLAAQVGKYFCGLFVIIGIFGMDFRLFGLIGPIQPNFFLAFIGGYIYFAGQQEYRMVLFEQQANRFNFQQAEDFNDVEVSPPPYASGQSDSAKALFDRIRNLFRK